MLYEVITPLDKVGLRPQFTDYLVQVGVEPSLAARLPVHTAKKRTLMLGKIFKVDGMIEML